MSDLLDIVPRQDSIPLSQIVFDEVIYPRKTHDPVLVQRYVGVLDQIEATGKRLAIASDNKACLPEKT